MTVLGVSGRKAMVNSRKSFIKDGILSTFKEKMFLKEQT
jgi:hypothetical protein